MASGHLDQMEFVNNPEPRCAVVLLLDTSGSMQGQPVAELNDGLKEFAAAVKSDPKAALRVEVALVVFGGGVRALDVRTGGKSEIPFDANQAFVTVDHFQPPYLDADGETPIGEAVRRGLALVRQRKAIYKQNSLDYFRPWIFLITDGKPTDTGWESAADQVKEEEARKGVLFYAVGVENADMQTLARFSDQHQPLKLRGLAFRELFQWLSKSLTAVANVKQLGDQAPLAPVSWAQADTSH